MLNKVCNDLTGIAISVIIAFVFTLLFYTGIVLETSFILIFALVFSLLSLLLIGLFGTSDNGLTRQRLCQSCLTLIISVTGNILFSLFALTIPITSRKYCISNSSWFIYFLLHIKFY